MTDDLLRRLEAVERAVTDGNRDFEDVADAATVGDRLARVERRLDEVEERLAALDAATQAVRGYLSGVDGVTEDVERQAALALAKAEALEARVTDGDDGLAVERLPRAADGSMGVGRDAPTGDRRTPDVPADRRAADETRAPDMRTGTPRGATSTGPSEDGSWPTTEADADGRDASLASRLRDVL